MLDDLAPQQTNTNNKKNLKTSQNSKLQLNINDQFPIA